MIVSLVAQCLASYGTHKIVLDQGMVKVGHRNGTGVCVATVAGV